MMKMGYAAVAAMAMVSGVAMGATVDMSYVGVAGGNNAATVRVGGSVYYAGHMIHQITSGERSGQMFNSFCIDVAEAATPGSATYQIIDLADAPVPGTAFGQDKANAVSAIVANAIAKGWIDSFLQADTSQAGYLGKMGAIQAAIWKALGFNVNLNSSHTSSTLVSYHSQLMNGFDDTLRTAGLKAMTAPGQQDMLIVVPLPPAAFAGLGMLVGLGGVHAVRRRRAN